MTARFEHRDLDRWTVTVEQAIARAPHETAKVVGRGANNIKKDSRRRARKAAGRHARRYPYTIGYDVWQSLRGATAEIGPDKTRKQGPLGNLLENGTPTSPPHPHMRPAGEAEAPRFEQALEDLAARLLEQP